MLVVFDMANMAMSIGSYKTSQRSGAKECGCADDWEEDADDNCDEVSDDDGSNEDDDGSAPERG